MTIILYFCGTKKQKQKQKQKNRNIPAGADLSR